MGTRLLQQRYRIAIDDDPDALARRAMTVHIGTQQPAQGPGGSGFQEEMPTVSAVEAFDGGRGRPHEVDRGGRTLAPLPKPGSASLRLRGREIRRWTADHNVRQTDVGRVTGCPAFFEFTSREPPEVVIQGRADGEVVG